MKRTRLLLVALGIAGLLIAYLYREDAKKRPRAVTYALPHVNGEVTMLWHEATDLERIQEIKIWKFQTHSFNRQYLFPVVHFIKESKEVAKLEYGDMAISGDKEGDREVTLALAGDWSRDKKLICTFMSPSSRISDTIANPFLNGFIGSLSTSGNLLDVDTTPDAKAGTFILCNFTPRKTMHLISTDRENYIYLDFKTTPLIKEKQ